MEHISRSHPKYSKLNRFLFLCWKIIYFKSCMNEGGSTKLLFSTKRQRVPHGMFWHSSGGEVISLSLQHFDLIWFDLKINLLSISLMLLMLRIFKEKTVHTFMLAFTAPFVCLILWHLLVFLPLESHKRMTTQN